MKKETDEVPTKMVAPDNVITFSKNIKAIIKSNCNSCHGANGDQTNFVNYDNAKTVADGILNRIQLEEGTSGFMQRNGSKLSQEDINLIKQWKTDGLF
jgi:cytochrome c553|tara:strand:- start:472 stop:765 length:294 start_codon:yes stop_codon:yes gene_type:complete